jgi:hypothetical protein
MLLILAACAHDSHRARTEAPVATAAPPAAASTPVPSSPDQRAVTQSTAPASSPAAEQAVNAGNTVAAAPAPSPAAPQSQPGSPTGRPRPATPSGPSHAPATSPAPAASAASATSAASAASSQPAPAPASTASSLDLNGLEQRLRDTRAIGVFTKLSLKNQVDDLLAQFKAFHQGDSRSTLGQLRQQYELLLMKVVSLLQNGDPALASAVVSSREAIWGILTDPKKFAAI